MSIEYYIIDTETTGLSEITNEVTEISIIRCSDKNQLNRFIKCEHPETVNKKALEVTGRTMQDLLKGDPKESVVKDCNEFFEKDGLQPENRCIVGHNIVTFDKKFLFALWEKCGLIFPANLWLDTLSYISAYAKRENLPKKRMNLVESMVALDLNPKTKNIHTAKIDSQNNFYLYQGLKKTGIPQVEIMKRFAHSEKE
jgi:DNA polymerase III alpha subunit (gram-positive type)